MELAEKIIELTESKSKIVYQALPPDDPLQRQPDITLAKNHLNWKPTVELEEGLRKTIAYFKDFITRQKPAKTKSLNPCHFC